MKSCLFLILVLLLSQIRVNAQVEPVYLVKMIKPRVSSELSYEDAYVKIDFVILSQIVFKLQNKAQTAIEIDWSHASFVDTDAGAHRVIHEGIRYIERDKAPAPTVVPPGANVRDTVLPSDYVSYESGGIAGWRVQSIFDGKLSNYEGKTIGMFLPIRIRGVAKNYQFTFRVEKDLAATAQRAKEKELATAHRAKEGEVRSDELIRSVISRKELGDKWPFTIDEGVLACRRRAVFLLVGGTVYALNGTAAGMTVDGKAVSNDLSAIQTDKAKAFDTSFMITLRNMGLELCK